MNSDKKSDENSKRTPLRNALGYLSDKEFVAYVDSNYHPYRADRELRNNGISRMEILLGKVIINSK